MSYVEDEPYEAGRKGMTSKEKLWPLYLDNLRLVLDSIEVLLENLDAERVAITADHGELLGELDQWGHFQSIPHPQLKRVPWVETTATDKETRHPDEEFAIAHDDSVQEQLADLGYL
jgi:membrane-anchored protein YejM (alkaline phosphatase superfamily)